MVNGWHRFHSAMDDTKHIGFTKNGRAIRFATKRPHRTYENCYNLYKTDQFQNDQDAPNDSSSFSSPASVPESALEQSKTLTLTSLTLSPLPLGNGKTSPSDRISNIPKRHIHLNMNANNKNKNRRNNNNNNNNNNYNANNTNINTTTNNNNANANNTNHNNKTNNNNNFIESVTNNKSTNLIVRNSNLSKIYKQTSSTPGSRNESRGASDQSAEKPSAFAHHKHRHHHHLPPSTTNRSLKPLQTNKSRSKPLTESADASESMTQKKKKGPLRIHHSQQHQNRHLQHHQLSTHSNISRNGSAVSRKYNNATEDSQKPLKQVNKVVTDGERASTRSSLQSRSFQLASSTTPSAIHPPKIDNRLHHKYHHHNSHHHMQQQTGKNSHPNQKQEQSLYASRPQKDSEFGKVDNPFSLDEYSHHEYSKVPDFVTNRSSIYKEIKVTSQRNGSANKLRPTFRRQTRRKNHFFTNHSEQFV